MSTATTEPTTEHLDTMKQVAGWFLGAGEARSEGYVTLPAGFTPGVGDVVAVRGRGNRWRRGVVLALGRTRITVGVHVPTGAATGQTRVRAFDRDAVMLKTHPCARCRAFVHPVYDIDAVRDVDGRWFCTDLCGYLFHSAQLSGAR